MAEVQKRGLLYELKDGYRIDMTEEEYREKREELGQIAARLHVNLDVLDLLEKDYRMRLIVCRWHRTLALKKLRAESC